ncbi:hypothetical protein D6779_02715 [Candidatus Parcubacteria bacterium]|nr:MAG: hypothetical protein D6779_02715 [Candidatus Parcubacteria bacterium]
MAVLHGKPGPEPGDQQVYELLRQLNNDWIVYAQPKIVYQGREHNPDYVLINKHVGLVVLEVKDRTRVLRATPTSVTVYRNGQEDKEESYAELAKRYAYVVVDRLQENENLRNHAGKLDFPYRYAAVLPVTHPDAIRILREAWGDYVLGPAELKSVKFFEDALSKIPIPRHRWNLPLTQRQIDAIRATIRPELEVPGGKGVYDQQQEEEAFKPLREIQGESPKGPSLFQRMFQISQQMPAESRALSQAHHIRLLRGYAGTGKTDVLVLRAMYLYHTYPDIQILVTTFNRPLVDERLKPELSDASERVDVKTFAELCQDIRKVKYKSIRPQNTQGVLKNLLSDGSPEIQTLIEKYGVDFLAREIQWIKEIGVEQREAYLERERTGLGGVSGRRLNRAMKAEVYQVFESYQQKLRDLPAIDWHDLYNQSVRILDGGTPPPKQYDAILVDEAQHFAPAWVETLRRHLKPGGHLFLADDPSQGIYRNYSWRERGIEVRGRTRWLRIPYRNTRQIGAALSALIEKNPEMLTLLKQEKDFEVVDLSHPALRDGELPELHEFDKFTDEVQYLMQRIKEFQGQGILASEIAIVHPEKYVRKKFEVIKGLQRVDPINQTGMEYRVVIIPQVQLFFRRNSVEGSWAEIRLKNLQKFYVAASRARDWLILSYSRSGKSDALPKELLPMLPAVAQHKHTG